MSIIQQQPTGLERPRVPLIVKPANRFESTSFDSKLVNGFVEDGQDGAYYVYKRPGLSVFRTLSGAGAGTYNWMGDIYAVFGTTLYKNGTNVGTVDGTGGVYTFSQTLGETPKLFLQNGVKGYTYDSSGGLVEETVATTVSTTGDTHSNTTIDGIPDTSGISVDAGVKGAGIPDGSFVVSVDSANQVTINTAATATATGVSLTFSNGGFQPSIVKGSAYLDGTTYVMTPDAKIYGSELNDPTTWNALNFLTAQVEPDHAKFLAKQLVYVIAFKDYSVEVFYDAANPVGSPLGAVQGAKVSQGCRSAGSVQQIEGILLWVSQSRAGAVSVFAMEGLKAQPVATPPIERLLQSAGITTVWSWSFRWGGHRFYGVTFKDANLTLVYDLSTGYWGQWTDTNGNYWPIVSAVATDDRTVLLQHESNGKLYELSMDNTMDEGLIIPWDLYTPNWDGETKVAKYLPRLDFIGDQTPGSVLQVRVNDNDFRPDQWSNFRTVDMGKKRPSLFECGTFNNRVWNLRHRCATKLRIEALEMFVILGTL